MKFLILFIGLFFLIKSSLASSFKLDQVQLEQKFQNAVEVFNLQEIVQVNEERIGPDKNQIALAAICCGAIGLHRSLMHHQFASNVHKVWTGLSIASLLAYFIISESGAQDYIIFEASLVAGAGILIQVIHFVYTGIEGLIYHLTPESRFNAKGGLRFDSSYFASFSFHDVEDAK